MLTIDHIDENRLQKQTEEIKIKIFSYVKFSSRINAEGAANAKAKFVSLNEK
jgi:hypothetical protein